MGFRKSFPANEAETAYRLQKALPSLLEGLTISEVRRERAIGNSRADMTLKVRAGKKERTLLIEIKRLGEPRLVMNAIAQVREMSRRLPNVYPVICASYLTESSRRMCREADVGYIDLAGNVYLRFDNVFIERSTPVALRQERRSLRGLGAPKTSRVIRTLLSQPKKPFQVTELAKASGVSPAEAFRVAELLELKGYAERGPERRVSVAKPGELLDAWASSLDFKKNWIFPVYSLERTPEAIARRIAAVGTRPRGKYALTMFSGAFLVAPMVRYYDVVAYVTGDIEWWFKQLDVKEVESGANLQLVIPRDDGVFMNSREVGGMRVVSDIQLYADLLSSPARGREAAVALREKQIGF